MIAIVYISHASINFDKDALKQLLVQCRVNNKKNSVTGMLLYKGGEFIQVIEGEEADVIDTFKRIRSDQRHEGVEAILKEKIDQRFFPFWAMGQCDPEKCAQTRDRALSDLKYDKVSVYKLLREFKNGVI